MTEIDLDDRRTPDDLFANISAQFGPFTVDAAASHENTKCARFWDRSLSGLGQPWADHVVWCNPPYSDCRTWVLKALTEVFCGTCKRVVMLLPANRTEQPWWQDMIEPNRDQGLGISTKFIRKRVRFGSPAGRNESSPKFGVVLVIFERVHGAPPLFLPFELNGRSRD